MEVPSTKHCKERENAISDENLKSLLQEPKFEA